MFGMDFDIVVIIDCGSISNEYFAMQATQPKRTMRARKRRNCVIIALTIPYTVLPAIPNVSSP
jgi:hypothetical protein